MIPHAQTSPEGEDWLLGWDYRRPITITEKSGSDLADYQIRIFIDNVANMNSNFSDLRFTDDNGSTLLDYWIENYNSGENALIWVKVPNIPENDNKTIYMYYGNASASSEDNIEATFSYSSLMDIYYLIDGQSVNSDLAIASYINNNQVFNGTSTLNLDRQENGIFPGAEITQPTTISILGPISGRPLSTNYTETPVPISFAGTRFACPVLSGVGADDWSVYSPFGDATVEIYNGGNPTPTKTFIVNQGEAKTETANVTTVGIVESDIPILVKYSFSLGGGTVLYPASTELYGISSAGGMVFPPLPTSYVTALEDATTIDIYSSGGDHQQIVIDRGERQDIKDGGRQGQGPAIHLVSNKPISAVAHNDGDSNGGFAAYESYAFWPPEELAKEYILPADAQYISIATTQPSTTVTISNNTGQSGNPTSISGTREPPYPNKVYFGGKFPDDFTAGATITADKPIFVYYEYLTCDETNLLSYKQARKYVSPEPTYLIEGEQKLAPTLLGPADGTMTNDNTPTFMWENEVVMDNYEIWIDNDPNFTDNPIKDNSPTNSYTVPDMNALPDENYFWRVRGYFGGTATKFSSVWALLVDTVAPPSPSSSPQDGLITDDNTPTLGWASVTDISGSATGEVAGVENYEIWIDNDPNFTDNPIKENSPTNSYTVTQLADENYSFKVRVWDRAGNVGAWSDNWTFFVDVTDFSVATSSDSILLMKGDSGSVNVSAELTQGNPENVVWSENWIGTQPSGVVVSFNPETTWLSGSTNLTFDSQPESETGEFMCRISGVSVDPEDNLRVTEKERTVDVTLTVAGMIFSLDAYPRELELMRSDTGSSTLSIDFSFGSKENVSLSGEWIDTTPNGVSVTLKPSEGTPSFVSVLTFTTSKNAEAGSFTYRVTALGAGLTRREDITVRIIKNLTMTLTTDNDHYEKGQEINISGTAMDPKGNPVENGEATITLKSSNWTDQLITQITDGTYVKNYYITFDKPEGDWTITVTAVDDHGNLGQTLENVSISVSIPASWKYYTVTFLSPVPGTVCPRSSEVTITVQITGSPEKINGADVYLATPSGEIITLTEGSPGIYSTTYIPKWDDPMGEWTVYVLAEKTVQDVYKAGTSSVSINITPADLELELLEPIQRTFEVGEEVDVKIRVSYPDGSLVGGAIVIAALPNGENLTLLNEGEGIYRGAYFVSSKDLGAWGLTVSAVDAYGNSGTSSAVSLSVEELSLSSYPIRYWWITIPVVLACALVPLPTVVKRLRIRKLKSAKSEIRATEKLRRELPKRYFVKGAISRETYDSLMHQSMEKLMKLKKEARGLEKKLKK